MLSLLGDCINSFGSIFQLNNKYGECRKSNSRVGIKLKNMNTIKFSYPKNNTRQGGITTALDNFQKETKLVELPKAQLHAPIAIKGRVIFSSDVAALDAIARSTSPHTEAIGNQKLMPEDIIGILSTSLLTLEFTKAQGMYKKALADAKAVDKAEVQKNWAEAVTEFKKGFAQIGVTVNDEKQLNSFAKELTANKDAFASVVNISNSKKITEAAAAIKFKGAVSAMGKFESLQLKVDEKLIGNIILPANLCKTPFAQGSFTKHFGQSFNLQVTLSLPCIIRWKWGFIPIWGWCQNTYNLAGLSYNVDLNVGYRVTCCGGEAWGAASANVCASILGHQFCAGCSAAIVGAVGIARTPSGSNCIYGLGLRAQLTCTFAGITVLNVVYPFGYTLTGPCPPLPC